MSSSSAVMPITPFIGVRISWLMVARNSDLSRDVSSALSRARMRASSASLRSLMSRAITVAYARPPAVQPEQDISIGTTWPSARRPRSSRVRVRSGPVPAPVMSASAVPSASRETGSTSSARARPRASASASPKMRSAAGFQERMVPSARMAMMASGAVRDTAPSCSSLRASARSGIRRRGTNTSRAITALAAAMSAARREQRQQRVHDLDRAGPHARVEHLCHRDHDGPTRPRPQPEQELAARVEDAVLILRGLARGPLQDLLEPVDLELPRVRLSPEERGSQAGGGLGPRVCRAGRVLVRQREVADRRDHGEQRGHDRGQRRREARDERAGSLHWLPRSAAIRPGETCRPRPVSSSRPAGEARKARYCCTAPADGARITR